MREQVLNDGYELFADNGDFEFSEEMKQVTDHTKELFIASKDREEWRVSWLESGDKPGFARGVIFNPDDGGVYVYGSNPEDRSDRYGVVRLLRV